MSGTRKLVESKQKKQQKARKANKQVVAKRKQMERRMQYNIACHQQLLANKKGL